MARERMVTRTVDTHTVRLMCVNVTESKVEECDIILTGDIKNADTILKQAKKRLETATYKVVSIVSVNTQSVLYGMPEADFIKYAKIQPPR